ncbi:MAG TPA: IPT/TIG domain-containing protein [Nitrospirales bacterium]|nr:IPT/TIG domain-containing protein [Nitrospirales bacterium]
MVKIPVIRMVGILAALAFAGQVGLAVAAEESKKKAKSDPASSQPGGGIQSNKAKASESPRLTKGKSCSGATPKIKKVTPDEGKTGDKVTIAGENFGEPGCVSMVSFGPGGAAKFTQVDDRTITVTVPAGKKGIELLTVTGFTGEDSKPFLRK